MWLLLKTSEAGQWFEPEGRGGGQAGRGAGEIEPAIVDQSFPERGRECVNQAATGAQEKLGQCSFTVSPFAWYPFTCLGRGPEKTGLWLDLVLKQT